MKSPNRDTYIPALISSFVLGTITLLIVFNADKWAALIPMFVAVGLIGLTISGRQQKADDQVSSRRWQASAMTLLISLVVYAAVSLIAVINDQTGRLDVGLVLVSFVIIPFYFGAAQLLSAYIIKAR